MRVAVLSDIHGVLPALRAVLHEPDVAGADRIVLTGDIAAGPLPVETLDALVELGERALWVRGNAERELVQLAHGGDTAIPDPIAPWAAAALRADQVTLLDGLPSVQRLDLGALGATVFCHATPRDDEEVALVDSRMERWIEVLSTLDDQVATVVCGHTHMPFARLVDRRLVVNPGSVGMPYGTSGAHWALLDGDTGGVTLRRTRFDAEAAFAELRACSGYPEVGRWADEYLRSTHSDVEAVRVFGPRDGRAA
ncbi:metallophosphoesterase family protein [Mangrovihabitans endophyticus]|uniref:Phosphoesterase n=1 Tax=Mangrovihabitans endophyticus TaxID=1751298 RepID=A0A8J3C0G2_9ACTN|nr:metallophosphoesterase family protein [Mangrovihabitans endophyticus]GGK97552.1 phosphoesterase [Mangrovihabitans endophyticus]